MIAGAQPNHVGSVCTALPTLLGSRTLITHGLQRLMGCILPTMHCRSQHCWKLLHPFADHCQHARNNSQHCCAINVGSCWVRLHAVLKNKGCTLSIVREREFSPSKRPNKARQVSEQEKEILWKSGKLGGNNPESFIQTDWTSIPWTVQPVSAACKL